MKVLVTGASGALGRLLCRRLEGDGEGALRVLERMSKVYGGSTSVGWSEGVSLTERERGDLVFGVKVEFADTTGMLKAGLPITVHIEAPVPAKAP